MTTPAATRQGSVWYTEDAEYAVLGDTIRRGDGSYTIIDETQDADAIASALANKTRQDSEFDWIYR